MDIVDFRNHGVKTQEAFRIRAIHLVFNEGYSQHRAAKAVGVTRQTVNGWVNAYRTSGASSLKDKRTNEHRKSAGILSTDEARKVRNWIKDKNPEQLKLPFVLWTLRAVRDLIKHKFNKEISISAMRNYLNKWGYTPQKPLKRAKQRNPEKIQKWLAEEYPQIASKAKKDDAVILWGDETCIKNHDQIGRSYAPKGKTPVIQQDANKFKTNMISALSNRGDAHFMLYDDNLNARIFMLFIKQLIRQFQGKKIVLIVDNLRVHHAKLVKKFVSREGIKKYITIEYLPAYAPEHNPDEYLNNDLKQKLRQEAAPKTKEKLKENTKKKLSLITNNPENIRAYFKHKDIKYAA